MLRNLILGLVLANLLLFIWSLWIQPSDVVDPTALSRTAKGERAEPELVLVQDEPTAQPPVIGAPVSSQRSCYRFGAFSRVESADIVAQRLSGKGFRVNRQLESVQIWLGHWVQLRDLPSDSAARQALARLAQGGLTDAYILSREPSIVISLGLFRSTEGADEVIRLAETLGYLATMSDRTRAGEEYWVMAEADDGQVPDPGDFQLGQGQIIRMETLSCETGSEKLPVTDGDDRNDSLESPPRESGSVEPASLPE